VLYSANNATLKINGTEILASNASLSLSASLEANYVIGDRNTNFYAASNGIAGSLQFNYFLTGNDYFKSFITGQGEIPQSASQTISGNFGGLNFDSGYLTSYNVDFSPNSPVTASVSIAFFDDLQGTFTPTEEQAQAATVLNTSRIAVTSDFETDIINNFIAGGYNYSSEVAPVYLMGETKPSSISFGKKTTSMNFEVDNPTGNLPVDGSEAKIEVKLRGGAVNDFTNLDVFSCSGVMQSRNLASAAGAYIKQSINVIQNDSQIKIVNPVILFNSAGGNVGMGSTTFQG
jgi:hypothetical protein